MSGFLVGGCLALLALRAVMLTHVGLRPPSNPSPSAISKTMHLKRGAFFLQWGEEITAQAVNDVKHRGVETSGSTARSDVRERSEGNPSPSAIYLFNRL